MIQQQVEQTLQALWGHTCILCLRVASSLTAKQSNFCLSSVDTILEKHKKPGMSFEISFPTGYCSCGIINSMPQTLACWTLASSKLSVSENAQISKQNQREQNEWNCAERGCFSIWVHVFAVLTILELGTGQATKQSFCALVRRRIMCGRFLQENVYSTCYYIIDGTSNH